MDGINEDVAGHVDILGCACVCISVYACVCVCVYECVHVCMLIFPSQLLTEL